ncbi:MAG: hypothetical protein CMN75_06410 [Spirochaeta sp.]|nr:hypothetical protein [Spirochaeta sp.]RPG14561.1 MAG: PDZ domain-containing protein [Proteobacteria bacterium TMED72]
MNSQKWWWWGLGSMVLVVGGVFLDLNSKPAPQRDELETTTRMNIPLEQSPSMQEHPEPFAASIQPGRSATKTTHPPEETSDPKDPVKESRKPTRLYRDARIQPVYDLASNRVEGVRIVDVAPNSFWSEIGVRSHDVILEFNGFLIETPSATVALMNAVSEGQSLSLRIRGAEGRIRFAEYRTPR